VARSDNPLKNVKTPLGEIEIHADLLEPVEEKET